MIDPATSTTSASTQPNGHHKHTSNTSDQLDAVFPQDDSIHPHASKLPLNATSNGTNDDHPDAPPAKRRRIIDSNVSSKSSPRTVSPPWKSFHAEGPTAFLDNGKRRSGRTNAIPLELQPQSKKRTTRAQHDKALEKQSRPSYSESSRSRTSVPAAKHAKTLSADHAPHLRKSAAKHEKKPSNASAIKKEQQTKLGAKTVKNIKSPQSLVKPVPKKGADRDPLELQAEILQRKIDALKSLQTIEDSSDDLSRSPSPPLVLKKVTFRVRLPKPRVSSPANIPVPRKYASFRDFIENDPLEDPNQKPPLSPEQIRKEAAKRLTVQRSARPGRLDHAGVAHKQAEPPKEYTHNDHLLAHINYFGLLLRKEKKEHRRYAQLLAEEAKRYVEAKNAKDRVKSTEELEKEQKALWLARFKGVAKDIVRLWQAVEAEVNAARQQEYEHEQQEKLKGHLNRVLDRTDAMLKRQDTDLSDSEIDNSMNEGGPEDGSDTSESDDSEQMSASDTDSESSVEGGDDPDANMTVEQLKAKYENITDLAQEVSEPVSPVNEADSAEEDSDPETIMDSELDSTDNDSDDDSEDDENDDSDGETGGLLALFSKKEIESMAPADAGDKDANDPDFEDITSEDGADSKPTPHSTSDQDGTVSLEGTPLIQELPDEMVVDEEPTEYVGSKTPEVQTEDTVSSREPSNHTSPRTSVTKVTEVESISSAEVKQSSQQPNTSDGGKQRPVTSVSPLLRGTLREYQHEGLDWLANLYASGRSGILADEMGLGKTIQSIALLAHLATTYEVWGPHLIVVPTSVMLNWEMEFKKFLPGFKILTYYGDKAERKQKRRGWMADDSFNVIITSYQLVLQDANSFKRRKWHYMILDEAHNIKNFRSDRWQTMMTFNTRARLLLTGTPLQNNLTELWSLLFFLHYGQESEGEDDAFAGLQEWSEWFKRPVQSILEHGKQVLDQEDQAQVAKLHKVIRPFLLRRLKADVEKQMPLKYEHVEMCRLSKRQRQLYDGFMSRAQTRETLASGNYLSIINALMQLRKVCNHPDLFETRPINTSFAMPRSVAADFEISDLIVRKKLHDRDALDTVDLDFLHLVPVTNENVSILELTESSRLNSYQPFRDLRERQWLRVRNRANIFASADRGEIMSSLETVGRNNRLQLIDRTMYYDSQLHHRHPMYGTELLSRFDIPTKHKILSRCALDQSLSRFWDKGPVFSSVNLVQSLDMRSRTSDNFVQQYACITPAVVATDLPVTVIGESRAPLIREHQARQSYDPFHQARMKLSIAFPDKRLLQYDCGKLQRLDKLLRQLQAGGHRALIFTQMTKVLDILEQFLNIHGHRYLRLDGATKIEQRQILTDRFNNDTRILCFILSSRSGGLGINLTGADTVIFYDLDWNPAMDKQCTDRAHRIGQTRDVHIYRFVSEHTIESNILRKANQKQLLDDVVIQEGDFTTDYLNKLTYRDMLDDKNEDETDDVAGAAMDRVLGGNLGDPKHNAAAFEQAEDKDDVAAARVAEKEVENADNGDFDDLPKAATGNESKQNISDPYAATSAAIQNVDQDDDDSGIKHIDEYMLRLQRFLLKDTPIARSKKDRSKKGARTRKKGGDRRR